MSAVLFYMAFSPGDWHPGFVLVGFSYQITLGTHFMDFEGLIDSMTLANHFNNITPFVWQRNALSS